MSAGRLSFAHRAGENVHGHWLLAHLGKQVLRPGGIELTHALLDRTSLTGADVVELAPGRGWTAAEVVAREPRSYHGVDRDAEAARRVRPIVQKWGDVRTAEAARTGLPDASADVVLGEALLTLQSDRGKAAIVEEAVRLLRPGGRYAIHELGLTPDTLTDEIKSDVRQALAHTVKVNARPLTSAEWTELLTEHGLVVDHIETAPMALLQPGRLIADEGLRGATRFAANLLAHPPARKRVLAMRKTFRTHRAHLMAVALVAHKPEG
ncbi:class I SAM-dependent methyltransferase [Amycolatopsis jejuensis]|uniref:class I SAM-dependent methyltransferase n=1 Tax=Amycolatopsis jejuensis TaxID=330084 RepID=UPI0005242B65|nr:class I SAM-dependent methyltransferase [Amycolatopsis jejuensis]